MTRGLWKEQKAQGLCLTSASPRSQKLPLWLSGSEESAPQGRGSFVGGGPRPSKNKHQSGLVGVRHFQKNPRAHKNKIGTPPPPPKTPAKKGEFYGHGFSCRKNAFFPGVHKIGAPISGPRIADTNFTDTKRIFSPFFVKNTPFRWGRPSAPQKATKVEQRQPRDDFRDGGWGSSLPTCKAPLWHSNEGLPELEGREGREIWRESSESTTHIL